MVSFSINDKKRNIKLPKSNNVKLAEFLGILTGDGYMNVYRNYDYIIEIAGNKESDKNFLKAHVTNLIKELFNINPSYIERHDQNTAYLRVRSKAIFNYLLNKEFKRGIKGNIKVPEWVKNNKKFRLAFIKGLFDTDGCVSLKNKEGKKYPVASLASKSKPLLKDIKRFLELIGLKSCMFSYEESNERYKAPTKVWKLEFNGHKRLNLWFEKIGSSNDRNLSKYNLAKGLV
jgi:intein/homing endonuclease